MITSDCTLVAQFFLTTPETPLAREVAAADGVWLVPPLWRSEFRNVLRKYLLNGDLSLEHCIKATMSAESRLRPTETSVLSADVMTLVATSRCSSYDAEYVSLAQSFSVPLVTSDKRLREIFPGVAISPAEFLATNRGES